MNTTKKLALLSASLFFGYVSSGQNTFPSSGFVGIGASSPTCVLDVRTATPLTLAGQPAPTYVPSLRITNNSNHIYPNYNLFEINSFRSGVFGGGVTEKYLNVKSSGQVEILKSLRIGSTAAAAPYENYKLSVDGDIVAKRCVIQIDSWADYVFADNYSLPTLNEVESFVNENKHLPGVPSESEIKEKGLDMGEMNKILMQKVEELTLYMIEQNKKIEELEAKVNKL